MLNVFVHLLPLIRLCDSFRIACAKLVKKPVTTKCFLFFSFGGRLYFRFPHGRDGHQHYEEYMSIMIGLWTICSFHCRPAVQGLQIVVVGIVDGHVDFIVGRIVACEVEQEESLILHGFGLITSLEWVHDLIGNAFCLTLLVVALKCRNHRTKTWGYERGTLTHHGKYSRWSLLDYSRFFTGQP